MVRRMSADDVEVAVAVAVEVDSVLLGMVSVRLGCLV